MDELLERVGFARSILAHDIRVSKQGEQKYASYFAREEEFECTLSAEQKRKFKKLTDYSSRTKYTDIAKGYISGYLLGVETVVRGLSAARDEINWDEEWLIELFTDFIEEKEA